jgi:hypothetical protein
MLSTCVSHTMSKPCQADLAKQSSIESEALEFEQYMLSCQAIYEQQIFMDDMKREYGQHPRSNMTTSLPYMRNQSGLGDCEIDLLPSYYQIQPPTSVSQDHILHSMYNSCTSEDDQQPEPPNMRGCRESVKTTSQKTKSAPYPKKDQKSASPKRKGHRVGFNKVTGKDTLVGRYPPIRQGNPEIIYCPDPRCQSQEGKKSWTTQNGYKYHLMHNCYQNPDSDLCKTIADGTYTKKPASPTVTSVCYCGRTFTSINGFRLHQNGNRRTKNGKCLEKRGMTEADMAGNDLEDSLEEDLSIDENASWGEPWDPQLEHMTYGASDFQMSLP